MDDEKPNHDNSSPSGGLLFVKVVNVPGENDGNDEVAQGHAEGTDRQDGLTTDAVDPENGGEGGDEHDDTDNTRSKETGGVRAETELGEDGGSIIENL